MVRSLLALDFDLRSAITILSLLLYLKKLSSNVTVKRNTKYNKKLLEEVSMLSGDVDFSQLPCTLLIPQTVCLAARFRDHVAVGMLLYSIRTLVVSQPNAIDWCISKVIHNLSWIGPDTDNRAR